MPLRLLSDERLVRRIARGDTAAFALIAERHDRELLRHCRAILRNDDDARDAVQNAFERALRALENEQRTIALRPWLFRIAHNEAISLMRRRPATGPLDDETADRHASVESQILMSERLQQLLDDLTELPDRQSGALLMRELSGLSYAEIGVALDTSEQAARQSVYEARVMLLDLAKGRDMDCDDIRLRVSARDGRLLRPRHVRAHLRVCGECSAFHEAIGVRRTELAALSPPALPLAATAVLRALFSQGHHDGGGLAATFARAADPFAASLTAKGAAVVTAVALAGGGSLITQGPDAPPRPAVTAAGGGAMTVPGPAQRGHGVAATGPVQSADHTRPSTTMGVPGARGPSQAPLTAPRGADAPAAAHGWGGRPATDTSPTSSVPGSAPAPQPESAPGPARSPSAGDHGSAGANPGDGHGNAHTSTVTPGTGNPGNPNPGNGNPNPGNASPAAGNGNPSPGNGNPGNPGNPGNGNPGNPNPGNGNPGNAGPANGQAAHGSPGNPNPGPPGGQGKAPGKGK